MTTINTTTSTALIIVALLISSCGTEQPKPAAVDLKAEAEKLDSAFLTAFNAGDAEAIMQLHWNSSELRAYTPGEMEVKGYDAVKASYVKDFAGSKGATLTITEANNIVYPDVVVGHGRFTWAMPVEGGAPMTVEGRYTEVKAMKDGKMVIVLDHTSAPMAPPPAEGTPADSTHAQQD